MILSRQKGVRRLAVLALFAILAVAAYGFAATNIVPGSKAGDGTGPISGFVISNIDYELDAATPTNIESIEFDLDTAPFDGEVWVQLSDDTPTQTWAGICPVVGVHVTCTSVDAPVATAFNLRVVAVD